MCKQSKVIGFEGRESTLTINEPRDDYYGTNKLFYDP